MHTMTLSASALALFKRHVELGRTIDIKANRPVYEELARAGLMIVGNSFAGGQDSVYNVTKLGFERKAELVAQSRAAGSMCHPYHGRELREFHYTPKHGS